MGYSQNVKVFREVDTVLVSGSQTHPSKMAEGNSAVCVYFLH